MGVHSDYKKNTTKECHYCDYLTCRKGHKCKWYKKFVKMFARRKKVRRNEENNDTLRPLRKRA